MLSWTLQTSIAVIDPLIYLSPLTLSISLYPPSVIHSLARVLLVLQPSSGLVNNDKIITEFMAVTKAST